MLVVKRCRRCENEKPLADFHADRSCSDGRRHICKACAKAAVVAWREEDPERWRQRMLADHERRKEKDPEAVRRWKRSVSARRRARLREAAVERVDLTAVWERDEGVCGICGEPADSLDWHLDHVIPIARGGEHSMANVQVAHPICNRRKGARLSVA